PVFTTSRSRASPTGSVTAPGARRAATTASPAPSAAFANLRPIPRPAPVMNQTFVLAMSFSPLFRRPLFRWLDGDAEWAASHDDSGQSAKEHGTHRLVLLRMRGSA